MGRPVPSNQQTQSLFRTSPPLRPQDAVSWLPRWITGVFLFGVMVAMSGCQLANMAKFGYDNATATYVWEADERTTTLPFKLIDDHIILPVRVNGSDPLNFVLDSGAAASVIFESRATDKLSLELGGTLPVSGAGAGPDPVAYVAPVRDLSLGHIHVKELSLVYLPIASVPFFSNLDEVYFDGVIGAQFFSRYIVEIDHDQKLITFIEPETEAALDRVSGPQWQSLPLTITSGLPYLNTQVKSESGDEVTVKLLVDTGFRGALSLNPATHDSIELPDTYYSTVGQGLSGDIQVRLGITESLRVGPATLSDVPVKYSIAGGESDNDSNGLLGNEVLQRFNLIFDYPNERMLVSRNQHSATPFPNDRSGLLLRPHRLGAVIKSISTDGIEAVSATSELRQGDIITSIDQQPVTSSNLSLLKTLLSSDATSVSICWLSGEVSQCGDLALASRFRSHGTAE